MIKTRPACWACPQHRAWHPQHDTTAPKQGATELGFRTGTAATRLCRFNMYFSSRAPASWASSRVVCYSDLHLHSNNTLVPAKTLVTGPLWCLFRNLSPYTFGVIWGGTVAVISPHKSASVEVTAHPGSYSSPQMRIQHAGIALCPPLLRPVRTGLARTCQVHKTQKKKNDSNQATTTMKVLAPSSWASAQALPLNQVCSQVEDRDNVLILHHVPLGHASSSIICNTMDTAKRVAKNWQS